MGNAGLVERTHDISEQASARLLHVLLDGLRASAATDGPVAPSAPATEEAMRLNSGHRLGASTRKTKGGKGIKEPVCPQTTPPSTARTTTRSASEKDN